MSTIVRPAGNRPGGVYWRRRLFLLALVLLLLWAARHFTGGDDPGASAPASGTAGTSPATTTATPAASPSGGNGTRAGGDLPSRGKRRSPVTVALGQSYGGCNTDQVMVRPAVPDGSYAGEPVPVELTMSTTAKMACTLDLSSSRLLVAIVGNDDDATVWESNTCPDALPTSTVQLDPTWSTVVAMTWSGRESGARCRTDAPLVDPGAYTVKAAMLGGGAAESDVTLTTRPAPDPKPTSRNKGASRTKPTHSR
ncbi:MAG: hypothetical protein ACR2K3_04860 [Nocardioides sp.]